MNKYHHKLFCSRMYTFMYNDAGACMFIRIYTSRGAAYMHVEMSVSQLVCVDIGVYIYPTPPT